MAYIDEELERYGSQIIIIYIFVVLTPYNPKVLLHVWPKKKPPGLSLHALPSFYIISDLFHLTFIL